MAKRFQSLSDSHKEFICRQKLFFVATAAESGTVNLSPKGMDSLRVLDEQRLVWLNVTGSGNETAAHIQLNPRMTLMFCAFEDPPMILRVYGHARVIHHNDKEWESLYAHFKPLPAARQLFDLRIDLVQTSCGTSVPMFDYVADREQLNQNMEKRGEAGVRKYWGDKNQTSLDGFPTHIVEKNL